jgi:hypothetical protein
MEGSLRIAEHLAEDWMIWLVLAALGSLAWAKFNYSAYVQLLTSGLFNYRLMRQEIREVPVLSRRGLVAMIPFSLLFWSLLLFLLLKWQAPGLAEDSASLMGRILVFFIGVYTLKFIMIQLLEGLLGREYGLEEYLFNVFYFLEFVALLGFPFLLLLMYFPLDQVSWIAPILFFLAALSYVWRLIRGIQGALSYRSPLIYIILYLCTLEIFPMWVLIRLVQYQLI